MPVQPAYSFAIHSSFLDTDQKVMGGILIPQFKKGVLEYRPNPDNLADDIIEEALNLFRPNSFCKSFDIRGPADRTLVYLLLTIGDILGRLRPDMSLAEARKVTANLPPCVLHGEARFPLNETFPAPKREEIEPLKSYLSAARSELIGRLLARVYAEDDKVPNPWWMSFQKKRFMNKSF